MFSVRVVGTEKENKGWAPLYKEKEVVPWGRSEGMVIKNAACGWRPC